MSKLEVDAVEPQSGTSLTLGASGDTITIPSGAIISNQGTATGFGPTGAVSWDVANIKTSGFTAVNGLGYFCNTTSSAFTVTLPASPAAGNVIAISDYASTFATNKITVNPNGNKIAGSTDNKLLNTNGIALTFVYVDSIEGWIITDSGLQSNFSPPTYSVDFLVIAGGGGGGGNTGGDAAGGGGAGGYRTSTQTFNIGSVYTITIGDGGAGGISDTRGTSGSASSVSGSGITTITSAGGGGGGAGTGSVGDGLSGGSGGGSYYTKSGGAGNTPSTSPSQGNRGGNNSAANGGTGGGGAGSTGVDNGSSDVGTAGGAGTASSITGSSVTRAGGGGGGTYSGGAGGAGGTGGGGAGGNSSSGAATAGTANTGGGGGCGDSRGNGGSGVVILRYPNTFTITIGAGLTGSTTTVSTDKVTTITAGTGNVSWA